jgi:hypothetical protein
MSGIEANPFYVNPNQISSIGNTLVKAMMPDKNAELNAAHAKYYGLEADKLARQNDAHTGIMSTLAQIHPGSPVAAQFLTDAYSKALAAGIDPTHISNAILGLQANGGADDGTVARAMVGSGKLIGKDQAVSLGDRENVAARDDKAALNRTATAAGISAGAHLQGIRETNQFNEDHPQENRVKGKALQGYIADNPGSVAGLFYKPENTPEGTQTRFAPGDPRSGGPMVDNQKPLVVPGGSTAYLPPNDPRGVVAPLFNPKALPPVTTAPGATTHFEPSDPRATGPQFHNDKPDPAAMKVTPNELAQIEANTLAGIGMWDEHNREMNPTFYRKYGAKMADARNKATEVFQATRNAAKAQDAYLGVLGIAPGSVVETPGAIGRLFGAESVGVTPPKGAAPAAPKAPENRAGAIQEAKDAIARGAPRDAVMQRLKLIGIDPGEI